MYVRKVSRVIKYRPGSKRQKAASRRNILRVKRTLKKGERATNDPLVNIMLDLMEARDAVSQAIARLQQFREKS